MKKLIAILIISCGEGRTSEPILNYRCYSEEANQIENNLQCICWAPEAVNGCEWRNHG